MSEKERIGVQDNRQPYTKHINISRNFKFTEKTYCSRFASIFFETVMDMPKSFSLQIGLISLCISSKSL